MDLRKIALIAAAASLSAAAPVWADDMTDAQNDPSATGQSHSRTYVPRSYYYGYESEPQPYYTYSAPQGYYGYQPYQQGYYAYPSYGGPMISFRGRFGPFSF